MKPIYLLCAVPGSGKTWVAKQMSNKFNYLPHDNYPLAEYASELLKASKTSDKPILGEVPFRISLLIDELKHGGADVKTHWIIESPKTVRQRYESREQRSIPKQHLTRLNTIKHRSVEYGGPTGTSSEILEVLRQEDTGEVKGASISKA